MHKHDVVFNRDRAAQFNEWALEHLPVVVPNMRLRPGDSVADIGSGGGAFSAAFAHAVGPTGSVWAVDSYQEMLVYVQDYAAERGVANIETLLLPESGSGMPRGAFDLVFMRQVYHHLDNPPEYLNLVRQSLKPGGQVAIIDFIPGSGHGPEGHSVPVAEVVATASSAGLTLITESDVLHDRGRSFLTFAVE